MVGRQGRGGHPGGQTEAEGILNAALRPGEVYRVTLYTFPRTSLNKNLCRLPSPHTFRMVCLPRR